jgi:hypothetical protein
MRPQQAGRGWHSSLGLVPNQTEHEAPGQDRGSPELDRKSLQRPPARSLPLTTRLAGKATDASSSVDARGGVAPPLSLCWLAHTTSRRFLRE